ncbi:MAG: hypothetical protein KGJ23_08845 [Euryarchaeota archaeon]|nr:hypothetical protein [Euryarchaeota archaeon]MDE1836711.1 hypothetical protein [Euryarchaeota archaeon]MDE1880260.1 hypothetical protein [Euryarchaeota archaeon]MDE2044681.1 hypothetical protein [Thermoplasmata archaeon]
MKPGDATAKDWHLSGHLWDGKFDDLKMGEVRAKVAASPAECPFCHEPWPAEPPTARWMASPGSGNYEQGAEEPTRIWYLRDPEGRVMARSVEETEDPERIQDLADELNRGDELKSVVWDLVDLLAHRPLIRPELENETPTPWYLQSLRHAMKRGGDLVQYETPESGLSP